MLVDKNNKGQVLIITTVFMLLILASSGILIAWSNNTSSTSRYLDRKIITKEIAKAGIEKALFCLNGDESIEIDCGGTYSENYAGESNVTFGSGVFTTVVTNIDSVTKQIESTGYYPSTTNPKAQTTVRIQIEISTDLIHFNFATQVGDGSLIMENGSEIIGNIYSNSNITGSNGNTVTGDVWGAEEWSIVSNLSIGGDVHSDTIDNCTIEGDAYYNTMYDSEVSGDSYSPYPNPGTKDFPIAIEQIDEWVLETSQTEIIEGDFHPTGGDTVELGPARIIGNLILENNSTLILTGGVSVSGYVHILTGASIRLDSSFNERSSFIIADGPIYMQNNGTISGPSENSIVMLVSLAHDGGNYDSAIELKNNAEGAVVFAPNGIVYLHNNVHVTEIVAYSIHLSNNAVLEYDTGLINTNFSSGPGGGWETIAGTWQEVRN